MKISDIEVRDAEHTSHLASRIPDFNKSMLVIEPNGSGWLDNIRIGREVSKPWRF